MFLVCILVLHATLARYDLIILYILSGNNDLVSILVLHATLARYDLIILYILSGNNVFS